MNILVLGIGQSLRGDDAAGLEAVCLWQQTHPLTAQKVQVEFTELPGLGLLANSGFFPALRDSWLPNCCLTYEPHQDRAAGQNTASQVPELLLFYGNCTKESLSSRIMLPANQAPFVVREKSPGLSGSTSWW
jgi:hypothetical protein